MEVIVIIFGPPASGKGTQAEILAKAHGLPHLSTGDMFRSAISIGDDFSSTIRTAVDSGMLVDDSVVLKLVSDRIARVDCAFGFIMDGFPRNIEQAKAFDCIIQNSNRCLDLAIELQVSSHELLMRLQKRIDECSLCDGVAARSDDMLPIFKRRLEEFYEKTIPLHDYYLQQGKLKVVDGMKSKKDVSLSISNILHNHIDAEK